MNRVKILIIQRLGLIAVKLIEKAFDFKRIKPCDLAFVSEAFSWPLTDEIELMVMSINQKTSNADGPVRQSSWCSRVVQYSIINMFVDDN